MLYPYSWPDNREISHSTFRFSFKKRKLLVDLDVSMVYIAHIIHSYQGYPTIPVLTTGLVLLPMQLNALPCLERNISLRNSLMSRSAVPMIRSICESKSPPTRPARMAYTEVGGLVDLLQVSDIFLSQLNNLKVA